MKKLDFYEKVTIAGSILSFILFLIFVKFSGISVDYIVNIENLVLKSLIINTSGQNTFGAVFTVLGPFVNIFTALVLLVISLAFASSYGYFDPDKRTGVLIGLICAAATLVLFPTIVGAFFAASVVISFISVILFSNTYGKEFKKWTYFRVGSHSIGKGLLIINILLALGIFFAVFSNMDFYKTSLQTQLTDTLTEVILASAPSSPLINRETVRVTVEKSVEESELFSAYFRWLPISSAFGIWILMEFLRNLVLSHVAGIFTYFFIKIYSKE